MNTKRPMFTQRHYKAIAEVLSKTTDASMTKHKIFNDLCHLFINDNINFHYHRFNQACAYKL